MDNRELSGAIPAIAVPTFHIGSLESHEAQSVAALFSRIVAALPYYNAEAKAAEIAKYSAGGLLQLIAEDANSVLVARCDAEIIGACISRVEDTLVWLSWFVVDSQFRRLGIAGSLVRTLESSVRSRNLHKIWCDCRTNNSASKALLIDLGFEPLCTVRNHWYRQDFILWEKALV